MNLSEIKELVKNGIETAILNNEKLSKQIFFELLSKIEQLEQNQKELHVISIDKGKTRSYIKMADDFKKDCYKVANFLSLYEHEDLFPTLSQDKSFEEISKRLKVKKNTLKNWRDMFDGHNTSHRVGWNQKELPSCLQEIKTRCELMTKEEFLIEVKEILNIK